MFRSLRERRQEGTGLAQGFPPRLRLRLAREGGSTLSHSNHGDRPSGTMLETIGGKDERTVSGTSMSDDRATLLWRHWLASMARDAEAALAAAIAYRDMDAESREQLLDSLQIDAAEVDVPAVALYAPLLAVERDPERRDRLVHAIGNELDLAMPRAPCRGLRGDSGAARVYVLVIPLYLDFVQVLACSVERGRFNWVRHDPIAFHEAAPKDGAKVLGTVLEAMPVKSVLDDLAVAVLSHRRLGEELPEALQVLADLLGPDVG